MDLRDFQFMPLDVVRLRDSDLAATATGEEFRCAVLLWCASWHQIPAGTLPNDDRALCHLAGLGRDMKQWHQVKGMALRGFKDDGQGRLMHPVIFEKAESAYREKVAYRERKERRQAAAQKAADARWGKDGENNETTVENDVDFVDDLFDVNANAMRTHNQSHATRNTNALKTHMRSRCRKGEGEGEGQVKGQGINNNPPTPQTPPNVDKPVHGGDNLVKELVNLAKKSGMTAAKAREYVTVALLTKTESEVHDDLEKKIDEKTSQNDVKRIAKRMMAFKIGADNAIAASTRALTYLGGATLGEILDHAYTARLGRDELLEKIEEEIKKTDLYAKENDQQIANSLNKKIYKSMMLARLHGPRLLQEGLITQDVLDWHMG